VLFIGSAVTAAANMGPEFGELFEIADIELFDIAGNRYEYTEHYEQAADSGAVINIINRYGDVIVTPASTDKIIVDVRKGVIAPTQEEADELSRVLTYSIARDGENYRVWSTFNRDQNRIRGRRFQTSLTIQVPEDSALVVDNRNGEVSIADLTGDQRITNGFGRVRVSGITGSVDINSRNDSVLVENVSGSAKIENQFSNILIRGIGGKLDLRNRNGSVEVSNVRGGAVIMNDFGSVDVASIEGALNIHGRNSAVEVDGAEEAVTVKAQFENVRIADVKGALEVENRNGRTLITYTEPPRRNIKVTSQYGDVAIELPEDSAFTVDARTRFGDIESDFEEAMERRDNDRGWISGQVGSGGPEIRIDNRNGSVTLEKR
jgi:DUF4097 and DUF4098 domain-containing protein YvlB